jgi:triacylglycerol lipase
MTTPGMPAAEAIRGWVDVIDAAWQNQGLALDVPTPPVEKKPVVIVAGTFVDASFYERLATNLRAHGYQVDIYGLPNMGLTDIPASADGLAAFVDRVKQTSGADQVDIVAHSQGGLVARQYVKFDGGAGSVRNLVSLGTPNHGTEQARDILTDAWPLLLLVEDYAPALLQMTPNSDFLAELNEGDDTIGDVRYTNFYTSQDTVVTPPDSARLDDGATNVRIQDQVPNSTVGHNDLPFDPVVQNGIEDALRGEHIDLNN